MANDIHNITAKLWSAADELRADSWLRAAEYSVPVLGQVFLVYAEHSFNEEQDETFEAKYILQTR